MMELILEKGFEATTISEITERADVGRSTFYAHYADKEDLLQGSVESLSRHLQEHVAAATRHPEPGVHPALAFCLPMLEHAGANKALFAAMAGRRGGYLFLELVHDVWTAIIRSSWKGADEIAVQAIAGAFGSTISWWISKAPKLTPKQVEKRFRKVMDPVLR